jgi:crotonobetainyl-CoA:carnitine CoA-transferase CaiB-like acyl-CoA transferase
VVRHLGYAYIRRVKPDVVMISSCLMGQSGPLQSFAGYGNLAAALCGFTEIVGWPDRPPAGPFSAYTDYVSPRIARAALLAALEHRRRTGEGQHVDLAQGEAALHFLAPLLLDVQLNGRVPERVGNDDLQHAPHGVYPADQDDRWVAIACETDDQWRRLARAIGRTDLAARFRLSATPGAVGAAPTLGQHLLPVLRDILGYSDDRIAELVAAGALE